MRTKEPKSVSDSKIVVNFYLSEDLRQEANGKVSAIGLYTDRVVIVGMAEDVSEPTDASPILLRSLGFLFNISGFTKPTNISVDRLMEAGPRPIVLAKEYMAPGEGRSVNLLVMVEPCPITSFGKRKIQVSVGDSIHEFEYEIRRGNLPRLTSELTEKSAKVAPKKQAAKKPRQASPRKR